MKSLIGWIWLILLVSMSCKTPDPVLDPSFRGISMQVKGRQGWMIGQVLSYGPYATDKVKRGWLKQYDIPFFIRFSGAREKIHFTQFGPHNQAVQVSCLSKIKREEIEIVRDFFSIPLKYENYFAGNIYPDNGTEHWDFVIYEPDGDFASLQESGGIVRSKNRTIEIRPLRSLQGQSGRLSQLQVYGFQFYLSGKPLAAVSTINKGKVWIDSRTDEDLKVIISAVASAILLRTDLDNSL
jgi:hypothetical protein